MILDYHNYVNCRNFYTISRILYMVKFLKQLKKFTYMKPERKVNFIVILRIDEKFQTTNT